MQVTTTAIADVLLLTPPLHSDDRGWLVESFNQSEFHRATGLEVCFVQDNHSRSARGVLRGLHYQIQHAQGKLVRVTQGEVFDVCVDLRRGSAHFGRWVGLTLSAANRQQIWIPAGFAHGFVVQSDSAEVQYKTTDYRFAEHERSLLWCDPALGVRWPLTGAPQLSDKDRAAQSLAQAECFE